MRNKEQSTEQLQNNPSVRSQNSPSVQSTEQLPNSLSVKSNDTCIYSIGILVVLAVGVCIFFGYNTFFKNKKTNNEEKQDQAPKRRHILKVLYNIWLVVIEEKY